ncbi:acyltransferase [Aliidongia dinghuensis]|uniref:Acyltransferase n=1 Tax=Aliidongia dinghuensis TaxID=1867774 RepID=A0A8J2YYF9_9PROT|nr:acyltransferase [Aliidongia dinghuensis]GGF40736.1 acyltransferase [Aliidongia dinghuensis]
MNRPLSLLLDVIRFVAALLVFFHHAAFGKFGSGLPYRLVLTEREPVIVFFVLSGFVIAYSAETKDRTPGAYALNRLARLYSVVLPALVATVLLDAAGSWLAPALYADHWTDPATLANIGRPIGLQLAASGLFLNEIWWWDVWPGVNSPLWSLGYEAVYYLLFALVVWGGRYRWLWAGLAALAAGPKILLLMPLWVLGVAIYYLVQAERVGRFVGTLLVVGSVAAYVLFLSLGIKTALDRAVVDLFGDQTVALLSNSQGFLANYVTGILFSALLVGLAAIAQDLAAPLYRLQKPIRYLAGLTFALYLFHYPLVYFLRAVALAGHLDRLSPLVVTGGTLAAVALLAPVTEAQKGNFRRLIARIALRKPRPAL